MGANRDRRESGEAFVGVVGTEDHVEFTALGDNVNVTARLASAAGAGEVLVTRSAAGAAELTDAAGLELRTLDLRGRSESTDALFFGSRNGMPG